MKKILHIQVLPKLSGAQKVSLDILRSLPTEYDKYILFGDLLDSGDKADCIKQFEKVGVKVLLLSELKREICWNDIYAFWKIFKLCKKEKFDIVHTNSTRPGIIGRIAATLAGVPLVVQNSLQVNPFHLGNHYAAEQSFKSIICLYLIVCPIV